MAKLVAEEQARAADAAAHRSAVGALAAQRDEMQASNKRSRAAKTMTCPKAAVMACRSTIATPVEALSSTSVKAPSDGGCSRSFAVCRPDWRN